VPGHGAADKRLRRDDEHSRSRSRTLLQSSSQGGGRSLARGKRMYAQIALCAPARSASPDATSTAASPAGRRALIEWPEGRRRRRQKLWLIQICRKDIGLRPSGRLMTKLRGGIERRLSGTEAAVGNSRGRQLGGTGWRGFHHHARSAIGLRILLSEAGDDGPSAPRSTSSLDRILAVPRRLSTRGSAMAALSLSHSKFDVQPAQAVGRCDIRTLQPMSVLPAPGAKRQSSSTLMNASKTS